MKLLTLEKIKNETDNRTGVLDLTNEDLTEIPIEVSQLYWLKELNLSANKIVEIKNLEKLKNLKTLNLRFNQIFEIKNLEELVKLRKLDFSGNQIKEIQNLGSLKKLIFLDFSGNNITEINELEKLTKLKELNLRFNEILKIKGLNNLEHLSLLDLSDNHIREIKNLNKQNKLKRLNLFSNKITDLQPLYRIIRRNHHLKYFNSILDSGGNGVFASANNIPDKILNGGLNTFLDYYEQLEQKGAEILYEARIVVLGEPGSGKTTLFKKLQNRNILIPDKNLKSTHGININQELLMKHINGENIQVSIWDFGGQEIQNYLHQYFYAQDNLFVLVCDHRTENYNFDYWFEIISRLCKSSKIIIIRNNKERTTASESLSLKIYEERFKNLEIQTLDVDFRKNDHQWENLIQILQTTLSGMKRVNEIVPKPWKNIKKAINFIKNKNNYISYQHYETICDNYNLKERDYQKQCLEYLHYLGYALHYNDSALCNYLFINPEWITKGLYRILDKQVFKSKRNGQLTENQIQNIWNKNKYSTTDKNLLLSLLQKDRFEVCYKIEGATLIKNKYFIPVLFNNDIKEPPNSNEEPYILRFKFPFIPYGFFSRLIIRLYDLIWEDYVWQTGLWLKDEDYSAFLDSFKDSKSGDQIIQVSLFGNKLKRKELLARIRQEIFHIKKQLFTGLLIEEQIPCFCNICKSRKVPFHHKKEVLELFLKKQILTSQCDNSGEHVIIDKLLDEIINFKELKRQFKREMKKDRFKIEVNPKISVNPSTTSNSFSMATANANNEIIIKIQNILGEAQNLKEDFEDEKGDIIKLLGETEYKYSLKDIEKINKALKSLEKSSKENIELPVASKSRLKRFIDDLSNNKSALYKGLKILRRGKDYAQSLAQNYNKLCSDLDLPKIQDIAMKIINSI